GIWQRDNQPPWEFRDERWQEALNKSPREGCPIKGNISDNGQIYHTPWSPWYNRTKINEAKGERWFCDELEAVQAGWRAPYWP
ncbi:MAG: thermonuclease family protein, partial [Pseudomonadota bacterium]